MIVGLVVEAFLTLKSPFESGAWWPGWRPRFVAIIMGIIATIVYLNICLLYGVVPLSNSKIQCLPLPKVLRTVQVLDRLDVALNFVGAYSLIISSGIGVCVGLRKGLTRTCDALPAPVVHLAKLSILLSASLVLTGLPTNLMRLGLTLVKSRETRVSLVGVHQLLLQVSFARTLFTLPVCYFAWPDFRHGFFCRKTTMQSMPSRQSSLSLNNMEITEMETELEMIDNNKRSSIW
jgi:hypothetical protein